MKFFLAVFLILFLYDCTSHKIISPVTHSSAYLIVHPGIIDVEMDALSNVYVLDQFDRISKYDSLSHLGYHVTNELLGHVHSMDVGNPFKTLVFYRDQQTILLYDKTLSEIQRITLQDWNIQDVTAVCLAADNMIWLFDGINRNLVKTDENGNAVIRSDPFEVIQPSSPRPDYIFDAGHYLLLKEKGLPVSLFNDLGHYLKPIVIGSENFSVSGNVIAYPAGSAVKIYDVINQTETLTIPSGIRMDEFRPIFFKEKIYYNDNTGIRILSPAH